jgi:hypothetical protein
VLDDQAPNGWGRIALLTATLGNDPTLLVGHPKLVTGRSSERDCERRSGAQRACRP